MREFKRRLLEFKYDGEEYALKFPTVQQVEDFQKKATEGELDSELQPTYEWLETLGLPEGIAKTFEAAHLQEIVEELLDFKKK